MFILFILALIKVNEMILFAIKLQPNKNNDFEFL